MAGLSPRGYLVTADCYDCAGDLTNKETLLRVHVDAAREAGMGPYDTFAGAFPERTWGADDAGASALTLLVPLRESHLAVHTWPARRLVCIDLFTCGDRGKANVAVGLIARRLGAGQIVWREMARGSGGDR